MAPPANLHFQPAPTMAVAIFSTIWLEVVAYLPNLGRYYSMIAFYFYRHLFLVARWRAGY